MTDRGGGAAEVREVPNNGGRAGGPSSPGQGWRLIPLGQACIWRPPLKYAQAAPTVESNGKMESSVV